MYTRNMSSPDLNSHDMSVIADLYIEACNSHSPERLETLAGHWFKNVSRAAARNPFCTDEGRTLSILMHPRERSIW